MSSPQAITVPDRLLDEFPAVKFETWRQLVETEIKGAPFDKKMLTTTVEGITLKPLYRLEDTAALAHVGSFPGFAPFVRGSSASGYVGAPWDISQEIAFSSPSEFNHAARNSLSRGLNALNMVLDQATRDGHDPDWAQPDEVGHGGLSIATLGDLDRALEGIDLETTKLFVRSGASALPFAALLVALARKRNKSLASLRGCIEMDPLGVLSHQGKLPQSLPGAYAEMAALCKWAAEHAPGLQTLCVHSRSWHESGGHAVQELGFTLATAVEYLRQMNQRGLDVNTAAPRLRFAVTVGSSFFTEIAKLRALRMLWSRVVAAAGGNETAQIPSLHVRTSLWNKTVYDPYNNVLRGTVEAFAAVLGGCDSLQVGAFDEVARTPDDFSLRLARNTQLVLQRECDLDHTIDPSGGCFFVEVLTADLAREAWKLFQDVERRGGMEAALRAGFPQEAVARTAAARFKTVAQRRASIVGINQYVNLNEPALDPRTADNKAFYQRRSQQVASHRTSLDDADSTAVLEKLSRVVEAGEAGLLEACAATAAAGATLGEITRAIRINDSPSAPITPVCLTRASTQFEALRAAMDRHLARHARRCKVFLCNLGSPRDYRARAEFSRGFFAPGGFEVVSPPGFPTPEAAADAFIQSQADVAVICSTDEQYPALVPPVVAAIRRGKPAALVVLAGFPQDQIEAHKRAGIDEFIHVRADALDLLSRIQTRLGVER